MGIAGKRFFLIITLTILLVPILVAETYVIDGYSITIKGRTRESAVRRHIGYDEGTEFETLEDLEYAIERKRQDLLDLRIFKDVVASRDLGDEVDGRIPVTISFYIDGAISFIVFPSVSYDSNYGFTYQCYMEDQNFIGTTGNTRFSFAVRENDNKHDFGYANINSYLATDIPIGRMWDFFAWLYVRHCGKDNEETTITLDHSLSRKVLQDGHVSNILNIVTNPESKLRSGYRMVKTATDTLDFAPNEMLTFSVAETMEISEDLEDIIDASTYATVSVNLKSLTGFDLTPSVRIDFPSHNWKYSNPVLSFIVSAKDSLISWNNDFRTGYEYDFTAVTRTSGLHELTGTASFFANPFNWIQLSSRLNLRLSNYPDLEQTELYTQHIRGMRNDNILIDGQNINSIETINLDVQFKLFRIPNFIDVYIGPFVELGHMSTGHFIACTGVEMLLILDEWPGAPGRLTYARNLLDPNEFEFSASAYFFY